VSRFGGYAGLPVTFATVWALAAAALGHWNLAAGIIAARMLMALAVGGGVLRSSDVLRLFWLIPVRDIFGAAVWLAGLFGDSVYWGGQRLRLDREGRIISGPPAPSSRG
jgi:ceramide glucosyltransferase